MKTKFPFYYQPDAKDCGPTCLRIIAKHYGKLISLQQIRDLSETTRSGSNLLKLSDAAEALGFKTIGVKLDFQMINKSKQLLLIFILLFTLFATSCSGPNKSEIPTIDVPLSSSHNIKLTDVASDIKTVQLETIENTYLSNITGVILFDDKFYIKDLNRAILVFDTNGNFVSKLGERGEGPGEYRFVTAMAIHEESGLVYVGAGRKMMIFSKDFKLVNERSLPIYLSYLSFINSNLYAVVHTYGKKIESKFVNETILFEMDSTLEINDSIPLRTVVLNENTASIYGYNHYMSNIKGNSYLYTPVLTNENILRDTLYQFKDEGLIPVLKLNFEKPHIDTKGIKTTWIYNIIKSSSYIICEYVRSGNKMFYLYSTEQSKGYNLKEGILDEEGDPVFLRPLDPANDIFYYVKKVEYVDSTIEELNPIIGIVKLK